MTTPPPPPPHDLIAEPSSPPPTPRSRRPLILAAAAAAAVLLLAAAVTTVVWLLNRGSLDRDTARRECRTALEREVEQRADNLGGPNETGVLVSVGAVELQETWEIDNGWAVNATANYTLTTPLLGRTPTSVSLSCEATATDDGGVRTTVKNRL